MQKQEERERKDREGQLKKAAVTAAGPAKGKPAKGKLSAGLKRDFLPSQHGRRIEPIIDAKLKSKYENVDKLKEKKETGVVSASRKVREIVCG